MEGWQLLALRERERVQQNNAAMVAMSSDTSITIIVLKIILTLLLPPPFHPHILLKSQEMVEYRFIWAGTYFTKRPNM